MKQLTGQLFDPGMQPERTALSWRRTSLAIAVGGIVLARLLSPKLGAAGVMIGVIAALIGMVLYLASIVRYRNVHAALSSKDGAARLPGGAMLLATAGLISCGGLAALLLMFLH